MPAVKRRWKIPDAKRGFSMAAAALLAGLALAASASPSAQARADQPSREAQAARLRALGCGETTETKRFVVARAEGGTRSMEMCGSDGGDPAAAAKALSDAIDAEEGNQPIYAHSRMPELLGLRLMRAPTQIDPSLTTEARANKLSVINEEIAKLENEISRPIESR